MNEKEIDFTELDDNMINAMYSDVLEASSAVLIAAKCGSPRFTHSSSYIDNNGVKHTCLNYITHCQVYSSTYHYTYVYNNYDSSCD